MDTTYQPLGHGPLEADACPGCGRPYGFCACALIGLRILTRPFPQPRYLTARKFSRFLQLNEVALRDRFLALDPETRGYSFLEFSLVQYDLYGKPR